MTKNKSPRAYHLIYKDKKVLSEDRMKITVVGLGTRPEDITECGKKAILSADYVLIKTEKSLTYGFFTENDIKVSSCDGLYNKAGSFDELNELIVGRVLLRAKNHRKFVFCVNGSGSDDAVVGKLSRTEGVEVELISGVSNASVMLSRHIDPAYITLPSAEAELLINYDARLPLIITEIYSVDDASNLKLRLMEFMDDETDVEIYIGGEYKTIKLYTLDMQSGYDYRTALYVPSLPLLERKNFGYGDVIEILRVLRGENGCSWDKAQTHMSLRKNNIEEAYELVDAITNNDLDNMIEELGDYILQAIFHVEIAREEDEFDYRDVYGRLCEKLISRHTHIFGSDKAASAEEALKIWEKNKLIEKHSQSVTETLKDVPLSMAALKRAEKVQKRAGKVGFEWEDVSGAINKTFEEMKEVLETLGKDDENTEKEMGDLFFALCNVCRYLKVDPEVALSGTTDKFIRRFASIEEELAKRGKTPAESTLEEMDALWNEAKKRGI